MQDYSELLKIAKGNLNNVEIQKNTQSIAVLTDKGNIYTKIIFNALSDENTDEYSLLNDLESNDDTQIQKIICFWANGGVDLPSWKFRKMLCELNIENQNAQMLLHGGTAFIVKSILQTLK